MSLIAAQVAKLGQGPLREAAVVEHLHPLFSRVLRPERVYLANHSLGRPLNQMALDVGEAIHLWESRLGEAWASWLEEEQSHRARLARLIGSPRVDCVVPKTSAGQALRTVLNAMPAGVRVLTTRGEFDSVDVVLKQYAAMGRIQVEWVEPEPDSDAYSKFSTLRLIGRLRPGDLVVVSQVMFATGQVMEGLERLASACRDAGARLLVDAYHSVGVLPVDVAAMDASFMIGGSYKYLRGGPGACFLYLSPAVLESGLRPLDTGWFAKPEAFANERPDPPVLRAGGDAFLEATPPVLTYYQARSGQVFTLAVGVERMRAYLLDRLNRLQSLLRAQGIHASGGDAGHGAFLTVKVRMPEAVIGAMAARGVVADARGPLVRLCPDLLTTTPELERAAEAMAASIEDQRVL